MSNLELRRRLDEISECTKEQLIAHPERVEELKKEFVHSIRLVERAIPKKYRLCFDYALGIDPEVAHRVNSSGFQDLQDSKKFMKEAVLPALIPVEPDKAQDGDLIVYFNGDIPIHAGIRNAGRVISKWGIGHVYEHEVEEAPAKYGSCRKIYKKADSYDMTIRLIEFTRSRPSYPAIRHLAERVFEEYIRRSTRPAD